MMFGNQIPRIRIEPKRYDSDGEGAALLMEEYGHKLYDFQRLVLDCWLGMDEAGNYNVTIGALSLSRQNGKTELGIARCLFGLVIKGERQIWSSHEVKSYKKVFNRFVDIFTDRSHPEIVNSVKQIHYAKGEERIELLNGGSIEFMSRTKKAARGYDGISLVILDEAQEESDEEMEALTPILAASTTGTRQMLHMGTPPHIGCQGEVFKRLRETCIEDQANSLPYSWHEWSIPAPDDIEELDIENRELWYEANPMLGYTLSEEFTKAELSLGKAGFCRERLGMWFRTAKVVSEERVIDPEKWELCASDQQKPEGKTAYGVKFASDGSEVALCGACIDPKTNIARVSLIERVPMGLGIQWLANWLNERYKTASVVVVDGRNGVDLLIDRIRPVWRLKDSVIKATTTDAINAASMIVTELNEKTITWYRKQTMLSESALSVTKRRIGSGWGFGGENSTPFEAAALALYGVRNSKRDPTRKMRIG